MRMYSWASSSSHIVWDKNGGSTYRRPVGENSLRVFGFSSNFRNIETRTLGSLFYRRKLRGQVCEYLVSQVSCSIYLRGGRVVSQITSSSRPLLGEESLMTTELKGLILLSHNEALSLGRVRGPFENVPQLVPG